MITVKKNINLTTQNNKLYNASSIKVLQGLEGVRKRPGMYIGDTTDGSGLHHMVFEIIDNSIDESLAGFCSEIIISFYKDGSISIKDNGRGIPVDLHISGQPACEIIMCILHAGGKFDQKNYAVSGGLHGVGISVVNALSQYIELIICRNNLKYRQCFAKGNILTPLQICSSSFQNGTFLRMKPDKIIFDQILFNSSIILSYLQEQVFLHKNLSIKINNEISQQYNKLYSKNGIIDFIKYINSGYTTLNTPIYINEPYLFDPILKKKGSIEIVLQWTSSTNEKIYCFTNSIKNKDGGSHLSGFKSGLSKSIFNIIHLNFPQYIGNINITSDDVREGLSAVISIKMPDPNFSSQTKEKLISSYIKKIVDSVTSNMINKWFKQNKDIAKKICKNIILIARMRNAAKKSKEMTKRNSLLENLNISNKLSDCQEKQPKISELFIVEGDSAGGSAKNARNRRVQAVLPLKGKILNVEKTNLNKILSNEEISTLISTIGTGISSEHFIIKKSRYHKIILMTDADIDGSHIRILLLTFFFRQMKGIIDNGFLYIAQPPLYRCQKKKKEKYLKNKKKLTSFTFKDLILSRSFFFQNKKIKKHKFLKILYLYFCYSKYLKKIKLIYNFKAIEYLLKKSNLRKNTLNYIYQNLDYSIFFTKNIKNNTDLSYCLKYNLDHIKKSNYLITLELLYLKKRLFNYSKFDVIEKNNITYYTLSKLTLFFLSQIKQIFFIQRYKGLGEMNADQLWTTTMDPISRNLLQVNINDTLRADSLFSKLMGNNPTDRKRFINNFSLIKNKNNIYSFPTFF